MKGLINRLEERDAVRGSTQRPSLKGRERVVDNPTNIGAVSKAMLGKLPRDGVGRIWTFPSAYLYHLKRNGTNTRTHDTIVETENTVPAATCHHIFVSFRRSGCGVESS